MMRHLVRRRVLVVVAAIAVAGAVSGSLIAYFSGAATAGSAGGAAATSVNAGTAPVATGNPGRSVTLTWSAVTLANGHPVDGYLVTRWEATPPYAPALTTLSDCGGTITGLTCTEYGVPFGSWKYTVTPVFADNWRGAESPQSGTVIIGAASLSLQPPTLGLADFNGGSDPATLTGSLSGFASGEGIAFRLDDPSSGTVLGGSPSSADGSGEASVSVSLPRPSDGAHSIYASGDSAYPSQASASILVDTTPPTSSASGNDAGWHNTGVTVSLSADDGTGGSGVASISYQVDGGSLHTISGAGGTVTVAAPANHSNDGSHTIAFYATDNAGNVEAPANSITVKIDTTAPATSIATSPSAPNGSNGWFTQATDFTLSASDTGGSGVASTYYSLDGGAPQAYSGAVTIGSQGDHTVEYWSVDNAVPSGNAEVHSTAHVKVDTVKPATSIAVSPSTPGGSNGWYVATPSFTLSASDATSGVGATSYQLDGGATQTYSGAVSIPDGQHTITYWSTDNAGNEETHHTSATIKVDTVKPSTSITLTPASPDGSNGWRVSATSFTLGGSDASSGVATTFYKIDGGTTQTYSGSVAIPQGTHTVTYWSVDNAGNVESSTTTGAIKVDTVNPSTSIAITPATPDGSNGWRVSATSFTLSASDVTSGVGSTKYQLDGGSTQTYSGAVSIPNGQHTVTYWSVDNAGNTESAATTATIKVDTAKPTTSITVNPASPDGSNGWRVSATTFTLSASDADSGVASTKYQIDGGATQTYSGAVSIGQGSHTVTYWSVDKAGNTESANTSATIKVDTVGPSSSIAFSPVSPNGSNGWYKATAPTFSLSATDATSGVGSLKYKLDSGSTQTYSSAVTIPDGQHTIEYWAVDNAGNEETHHTSSVKVDTVNPTSNLSLTSAGSAAFLSGTTLFYKGNESNAANRTFKFRVGVADSTSGAGSATFPAIATTGWTHAAEGPIATPSGGPFDSSAYTWTSGPSNPTGYTISFADLAGNTGSQPVTFTVDNTAPTGGSVSYTNGYFTSASVAVTLGQGTDAGAGVNASSGVLQRASASLSDDNCGSFGSFSTIQSNPSSPFSDTGVSNTSCYKYQYLVTDNVGNQATYTSTNVAKVDTVAPTLSSAVANDDNTPGQISASNGSHQDTLTFTYSDANGIDPGSISSGWTGSGGRSVSVTFTDGGGSNPDSITIPGIGTVSLGASGWLTATSTKTETLSRSANNVFVLRIDTSPTGNASGNASSSFTWSASGGTAQDYAGNNASGSVSNTTRF